MPKFTDIVKVDDRGRIVIPGSTRKLLKLLPGTKLMMVVEEEKNEIVMTPFLGNAARPIKMRIVMNDKKGSLAEIASIISSMGINMMYTEVHSIQSGKAEWTAIADIAGAREGLTPGEIKQKILECDVAVEADISDY